MAENSKNGNEENNENNEPYLLEQDRLNCIGCGACVAVAPDHWEMTDDGKASIINGKERQDNWQEKPLTKQELQENIEAAESCPVTVIHITSTKDGKKII